MPEAADTIEQEPAAAPGPLRDFWLAYSQSRGALIGLALVVALILLAVFADVVAPYSPNEQYRDATLVPPMWHDGGSSRFILGTDPVGRDMLSRLIHGTRLSLLIGAISVTISLALGVLLGVLAGYLRGLAETFIMRLMDVMLALPSLLLAIAVVAILGPGLANAMYAIAIVLLPHYVRLTRAAVMAETGREYVASSRIAGAGPLRLMFNTILPNCVAPLIVQATLGFSTAILDAAALGFLGLGAQPPTPEWGSMLAGALEFIQRASWVVTYPGLAILVTVLAFNLMGDGLRDALDPRLKR
jgi:dipeptide transport system permease protein